MKAPRSNAGGFTLIEVLISVLVLLIGVLGVAGMQLMSIQANQSAFFRSQAVFIGSEILDAMRANRQGLASYTVTIDPLDTSSIPADPGCATAAIGCTPAQTAAIDLRQWGAHFADVFGAKDYKSTLPGGRARITSDGNDTYTVEIGWVQRLWDDTDASDGSNTRSVVTNEIELSAVIMP